MRHPSVSLFVSVSLAVLALAGCSDEGEKARDPGPRLVIEECRLVEPASLGVAPGQSISATGWVRVPGLTDATPGTDTDPELLARFGWGPDGSEPSLPGREGAWTWKAAGASPGWDGAEAGEPEFDQYRATTTAPGPGTYDFAFAFSPDAGRSWTFCDLDGTDRQGNGYSPEAAGDMVIRTGSDPCVPDPCRTPPPDTCSDNAPLHYTGPGTCRQEGTTYDYVCDFPHEVGEPCDPLVCHQAACVAPVPVDFCQHLGPASATYEGEPIEFRALVRVAGITDKTPGVDLDPKLQVQFGWGWDGTDPLADTGWSWAGSGEKIPDWTDESLEEELRGSDVYRATFGWAPSGGYDTAWRVSADGGATWTACDLDGAGGNLGYDPQQAGQLVVP
jgi:hypothetical protein